MSISATPKAQEYYEKRAQEGYGLQFPDGHVIRLYQHLLKNEFSKLKQPAKVFDFGCWNGTHAQYFAKQGCDVSGADIVATAVMQAQKRIPNSNIKLIDDATSLSDTFEGQFDLIFANQVLYFLDDKILEKRLTEFEKMLAPRGFFIATMISRNCFYSKHVTGELANGLETVTFTEPERLAGKTTFIRFTNNEQHLREIFTIFNCLQVGRYECDLDLSHSTEHYIFIGHKA